MNKIKLFLGGAALFIAVTAVAASKMVASPTFDYYVTNTGLCEPIAETQCIDDVLENCTQVIPGQGATPKLIYEAKLNATTCQTPLTRVN